MYRRPGNMPRFFQGRMFNRRSGGYAPNLYSGNRFRRASHRRFGTQVSPYGAGGGGRSQYHAGHAGHGGNVYGAMLAQARSGRGTNMGMRHHTPGYRTSRMHRGFRQDQASIKRDFANRIREQRRLMRGKGADRHAIRGRIAQLRGQHRTERRAHAQGIQTKWAAGHDFRGGGGSGRQWDYRRGPGDRRTMVGPRVGVNVGQDSYTGRRFVQGLNFRRQRGGGMAGFNRAQSRNMRIANRMNPNPMRGGIPYRRGTSLDMRLHGERGKGGGLASGRGVMRTHADFTHGGRRAGVIQVGNPFAGQYGGTVMNQSGRRPMSSYERFHAGGNQAQHARNMLTGGHAFAGRMRQHGRNISNIFNRGRTGMNNYITQIIGSRRQSHRRRIDQNQYDLNRGLGRQNIV